MATSSSSSIGAVGGSVIDVQSLSQQLVAADRKPLDDQIQAESARVTTQISAVGSLMGALSTFRSSLSSLKTIDAFAGRSATSADPTIFGGTATSKAAPGTYSIEVEQLAMAHQLSSAKFVDGPTQAVGTGILTVSVGTKSFNVNVDSANNTLAGIRDSINSAADNTGVSATIITADDGAHLVLTSKSTGKDNAIAVTQTGGDGGLAKLTYGVGNTGNYTEISPAQDAQLNIAGNETSSDTNTVNGAIDGVTLNLLTAKKGTKINLTIAADTNGATNRIKAFVAAYNTLKGQLTSLGSYNASTKAAGPMLGDSLLTGIDDQIRRTLSSPVQNAGQFQTLASIGITTQADGTLTVDDTKLQKALTTNFDSVGKLFGSTNGVGANLYSAVDQRLATTGSLASRSDNLTAQQKELKNRQADIDERMTNLLASYVRQFTSLDTLLSSLQTTSAYLTQQLSSLPKPNSTSNG